MLQLFTFSYLQTIFSQHPEREKAFSHIISFTTNTDKRISTTVTVQHILIVVFDLSFMIPLTSTVESVQNSLVTAHLSSKDERKIIATYCSVSFATNVLRENCLSRNF